MSDTYSSVVYQEQLMQISKKVSGFDGSQADSITRKITAKKKAELMPMMIRCHIYGKKNCNGPEGWENDDNAPWYDPKGKYGGEIKGALVNGYTAEEMREYFHKIDKFCSYAFNRSHSAAYGYISFIMAWLKCYYPTQYMAAVISMQDEDEKKDKYIKSCALGGIKTECPDINTSEVAFTPSSEGIIRYGLASIRGIGAAKVNELIKNAPYDSLEDMFARLPKQIFNKTVAENLAKCGALDCICGENRSKTLNDIHRIRKDKKVDILDENAYNRETCMQYEIETLGTSITYKSSWDDTPNSTDIKNKPVVIADVKDYVAKSSGKSMGKLKVLYDGANVNAVIFPKVWSEMSDKSIADKNTTVCIDGKKDKDGNLIIKKIYKNQDNKDILMEPFSFVYDM